MYLRKGQSLYPAIVVAFDVCERLDLGRQCEGANDQLRNGTPRNIIRPCGKS